MKYRGISFGNTRPPPRRKSFLEDVLKTGGGLTRVSKPTKPQPTLYFNGGFNPAAKETITNETLANITLADASMPSPNRWDTHAEQTPFVAFNTGWDNTGGTAAANRSCRIEDDPAASGRGKVLKYQAIAADAGDPDHIRMQLTADLDGTTLSEMTVWSDVYLSSDIQILEGALVSDQITWHQLMFAFVNPDFSSPPAGRNFQVSVRLDKNVGASKKLFWRALAERDPGGAVVWQEDTDDGAGGTTIEVPYDEWFTLVWYLKSGDASTGRYVLKMLRAGGYTTIFDVTNWMDHNAVDEYKGLVEKISLGCGHYAQNEVSDGVTDNGGTYTMYVDNIRFYGGNALDESYLPNPNV